MHAGAVRCRRAQAPTVQVLPATVTRRPRPERSRARMALRVEPCLAIIASPTMRPITQPVAVHARASRQRLHRQGQQRLTVGRQQVEEAIEHRGRAARHAKHGGEIVRSAMQTNDEGAEVVPKQQQQWEGGTKQLDMRRDLRLQHFERQRWGKLEALDPQRRVTGGHETHVPECHCSHTARRCHACEHVLHGHTAISTGSHERIFHCCCHSTVEGCGDELTKGGRRC
mmetsp:Transcript_20662/g.66303  ORF Transcript_20662/g.66303 Transcript_20662/m.66303 type:complete len:227 (-) Transcript_20662:492-1172(-)